MKRVFFVICAALLLTACGSSDKQLCRRAGELCRYIPDMQQLELSQGCLTDDFYAVLDTMYNLPDASPVLHEWEFWFVAADGTPVARCKSEVQSVQKTDNAHATAVLLVQPEDADYEAEQHTLTIERVNGKWLIADFDGRKADCSRYIANSRMEQSWRDMLSDYLVKEIGSQYAQGDVCVPVLMIVAQEDCETEIAWVWGDFWVFNYQIVGDTLKTVSGGSHSGRMQVCAGGPLWSVCAFEQTVDGAGNEASARRIFGSHYEVYQNMHSNADAREEARRYQLRNYVRRHDLAVRYYQDYGWPAVEL